MGSNDERSEIAFFDVETTVPTRPGQGYALLEFGAILVCPRKLEELHSYSSLVRPADPSLINSLSVRCNGITPEAVVSAPPFADISDVVYDLLHGRIWAGHNIIRFDCKRIREAFEEINRPPPEPKGIIDSLALLTQRFGRRAGDMKMATLAAYFGLGQQTHRSLGDVRMNLEVLKYCATVLFLESSLPDIFTEKSWVSPNATTRSRTNGKSSPGGVSPNVNTTSSSSKLANNPILSTTDQVMDQYNPLLSLASSGSSSTDECFNSVASDTTRSDPFDMGSLSNEMNTESLQRDISMEENSVPESSEISSTEAFIEGCGGYIEFLAPDEVCVPDIRASLVPLYRGSQRIKLLHKDFSLQICYSRLRVRFGISTKFVDHAGRPRVSFVVDVPPTLCTVLDACDGVVQKVSLDSGSSSEWRPVVTRKNGFFNYPTARLHIPTVVNEDLAQYATEMYQKESSGAAQKLVFSKFDAAELDSFFKPGTFVDAYFSLDPYDYQQNAGIRLVAKKLIIHSE
ncbi:hypothetical protein HS088_TW20G00538 [Tripterygium wilfordii]|uniref:Exonuclease domain-containing protein n=1 Tax=Tripterygium wilfordii TaxID=458696 RepID=A0A7J7C8T8_TRIWF|nr:protein NEN1-like [Tripterygium wilfordii]KAF5730166.1 hypothetical protein HS088_TW20G00538 [Tripterygium wilfordii]